MLDPPRSVPGDFLEFKVGEIRRLRVRAGLQRVKAYGIDWQEQEGWLASVFTVCGDPTMIAMLRRAMPDVTLTKLPMSRCRYCDIVA